MATHPVAVTRRLPIAVLALAAAWCAELPAATIRVNSMGDVVADDGACTFREAAAAVNSDTASGATPGECAAGDAGIADLVVFAVPGGKIFSNTGAIVFTAPVTIQGPGADALALSNATPQDRLLVFDGITAPYDFSLKGLTLEEGEAIQAYLGRGAGQGGGLLALDVQTLTLADVRFVGNDATQAGAGLALEVRSGGSAIIQDTTFENNLVSSGVAGGGGGMVLGAAGTTTVRRTLFVGNQAQNDGTGSGDDSQGGALWVPPLATGTLAILESTFSGNRARGRGGAISWGSPAAPGFEPAVGTTIDDSTFTLNVADDDADSSASGGAMNTGLTDAPVVVRNSIFGGNLDDGATDPAPDLVGDTLTLGSSGYNLVGIRAGAGTVFDAGLPNPSNDWVGTMASPLAPQLQPLAANGGLTRSHLPVLAPGSPTVDQGSCPNGFWDQREWTDPTSGRRIHDLLAAANFDDGCDIGAVEAYLSPPNALRSDAFESGDVRLWSGVIGWATP